uniref:Rx N-terminal domain-containing protein n=1 Tax=Aegilops tauschii subsp. strangulata TaxID=200361 RepID=A0A453A8W8_AEGTS
MRVSMVVEEADARYITNSGMLLQLKMLSEAMYRGYRVLDTSRYRTLQDSACFDEVSIKDSSSSSIYLAIPLKRSRTTTEKDDKAMCLESLGALESLGVAIANMAEFVLLLGGCERMSRRPYDIYLYTDNFMFGRHAEKQKLLSFLLQHRPAGDAPAILPIIGGAKVGKKTLVTHVCGDERVRSCFSSVLHLSGDSFLRHGRTMSGMKTLVVIEFASDVSDHDWKNFHSFLLTKGRGSHINIISRIQRLARFGSVKPIFLSVLSYDEWRYLFKTLAFGSVDPAEHPRLLKIADEVARQLHTQGSLVATNAYADLLRRNLNAQFWHCLLDKGIRMIKRNIAMYGVHPSMLIEPRWT